MMYQPTKLLMQNINNGISIEIKGNTTQDGTPSPDNPIPINCVKQGTIINLCDVNYNTIKQIILPCDLYEGDIFNPVKGEVQRNSKLYTFDGSEVFGRITQYDGENTLYCYYNKFYDRHATGSYGVEKCNIFKGHNWHLQTSANTDFEAMVFNNAEIYNKWYYFRVNKTRLTGTTAAAVKAWVKSLYDAGTPMQVWYQLETPITEQYPPQLRYVPSKAVNIIQVPTDNGLEATVNIIRP